ncbi:MAG: hypothetical protein WCV59_00295 [Parcubacteria group bacterium]|jgi:hypothetical protein
MAKNPWEFAQQNSEEERCSEFFQELLGRVDPDHFPKARYGADIGIEAFDLLQRINEINDEPVGSGETYKTWAEKLQALKDLETGFVDPFLAKAETEAEARATAKSSTGASGYNSDENDEAAEYEMGDKIKAEEEKEKDKEHDEASEYEMGDKINKEKEKEGDNVEKLREEMEKARKDYLEMDYKKRSMRNRVQKYFGKILKRNEDVTNDQDVEYMRNIYKNRLAEWKDAKLEEAKRNGSSNEDLGRILNEILRETNVNLAEAHNQVKIEQQDGKVAGVVRENLLKFNDWYKKQPLKYKLAVGAGLGIAGVLAPASLAAGVAYTALGRRIAMGAITGTGTAIGLEKMAQRKREKKVGKQVADFSKELEEAGMTEEEREARVNVFLSEAINNVDGNLRNAINRNRINLGAGILIGSFVSTGAASIVLEKLGITGQGGKAGEWIGKMKGYFSKHDLAPMGGSAIGEVEIPGGKNIPTPPVQEAPTVPKNIIPEKPSGSGVVPEKPPINSPDKPFSVAPDDKPQPLKITPTPEGKTAPIAPENKLAGKMPLTPEAPKGKPLVVGKWEVGKLGGSIEGEIKKHLEEQGIKKTEAGKQAHRIFMEFKKDHPAPKGFSYNKILPGAQIELDSNGKMVGFHDGQGSKWPGHIEKGGAADHSQEASRGGTKIPEESGGKTPEKEILEKNEGNIKAADDYQSDKSETYKPAGPREIKPENWLPRGEEPAEILGRLNGRFISEVKKMSLDNIDNWNQIKNRNVEDVISWIKKDSQLEHTKLAKKIRDVMVYYRNELGAEGNPKKGETVSKWLARVIRERERIMLESKKYSIAA